MDATNFRQQLSNQFAAATGLNAENSKKILFEGENFNKFDLVFGEPKLDLIKTQLQFFEMSISTNDSESAELLKQMLLEAQQTIFDYAVNLLKNKEISKSEFKTRAEEFISATRNENLKSQALTKAEKIVGEQLSYQFV